MSQHKQPKQEFSPFEEQAMKDQNEHDESKQRNQANPGETTSATAGRRALLNTGAIGAAAALLGVVAACSSDDDAAATGGGGKGNGGKGGTGGKGGSAAGGKAGSTSNGGTEAAGEAGTGGATAGAAGEAAGAGGAPEPADNDIAPLNALLTAEYNAITAYTAGAGLIGAAPSTDPLSSLRSVITNVAIAIRAHHRLHADALVDAIQALNGTPVNETDAAANFKAPATLIANPTISNVLKFAASAERGASVAYNQVLSGLEDAQLRFLASAIEGDESQHFIVLAALVLGLASPGPNLGDATAAKVVPEPFVVSVDSKSGLDVGPPDYFA